MKAGDIYKELTSSSEVPESLEEIWARIKATRKVHSPGHRPFGSILTVAQGSIFPHGSYDTDIDKYLKK